MLEPAAKHADFINQKAKMLEYDLRYQFVFGSHERGGDFIRYGQGCETTRSFASVDSSGKCIGCMVYGYNPDPMKITWIFAVSFDISNPIYGDDLMQVFRDAFEKYGFKGIEFTCYSGNPVLPTYRKLVSKFGGREVGYFKDHARLLDGQLYDSHMFEIMADDYFNRRK